MDTVQDFEDLLELLERHEVRYLIIGGLAFIFHAKPRFTKDMDLWIGPDPENVGCPFRRIRPPIPLEGGRRSERSDARGSGWMKVAAIGR